MVLDWTRNNASNESRLHHRTTGNGDGLWATLCFFSVMPAIALSLNFEVKDATCGTCEEGGGQYFVLLESL